MNIQQNDRVMMKSNGDFLYGTVIGSVIARKDGDVVRVLWDYAATDHSMYLTAVSRVEGRFVAAANASKAYHDARRLAEAKEAKVYFEM